MALFEKRRHHLLEEDSVATPAEQIVTDALCSFLTPSLKVEASARVRRAPATCPRAANLGLLRSFRKGR